MILFFAPRSIYFHQLYAAFDEQFYKAKPQIIGQEAHDAIDHNRYSTRTDILMGMEVYTSKYKIAGKIDVFDCKTGRLTERKREIKKIYEGYVFQVYAQYFGLEEMGYEVNEIIIHDMMHNQNYPIPLPSENLKMLQKFEKLISDINIFKPPLTPQGLDVNKNFYYCRFPDQFLCAH